MKNNVNYTDLEAVTKPPIKATSPTKNFIADAVDKSSINCWSPPQLQGVDCLSAPFVNVYILAKVSPLIYANKKRKKKKSLHTELIRFSSSEMQHHQ